MPRRPKYKAGNANAKNSPKSRHFNLSKAHSWETKPRRWQHRTLFGFGLFLTNFYAK
jgi:hypothetical protein